MKAKTKLGLSVLLGLSIIAMVACVIKTIELRALGDPTDFTMSTVSFVIWFTIEQYVVIIVASIPTLRPLVIKLSKEFTLFKGFKDFWKISDSNLSSDIRSRAAASSPHLPHSRNYERSWRPNVIRLSSQKSYDKLELEPPYVNSPPRNPPEPGTIRKTVSVYIRPATARREDVMPFFQTTVSANGQSRRMKAHPLRRPRTNFNRNQFDRDIEMQK